MAYQIPQTPWAENYNIGPQVSDFVRQFMQGMQMARAQKQQELENQRKAQEMELDREKHALNVDLAKQQLSQAKFMQRVKELELKQAAMAQTPMAQAPSVAASEQVQGGPATAPDGAEFGGPTLDQIQMPQQQSAAVETPSGETINVPLPYQEQAEENQKRKAMLSPNVIAASIYANREQQPRRASFKEAFDRTTGKNVFVSEEQLLAEPDRYAPYEAPKGDGKGGTTLSGALSFGKALNADLKEYKTQRDGAAKLRAFSKNPTGFSDLALIFAFMKTLDPGSVVRESEFQTARDTGSLGQRAKAMWEQVRKGHKLSAEQRADLVNTGLSYYGSEVVPLVGEIASRYEAQAEDFGLNFERYYNPKEWDIGITPQPEPDSGIDPEVQKRLDRWK